MLRRWDLNVIMPPDQIEASLLRLAAGRLRRTTVTTVKDRAWQLRKNITFSDACYVALAEALAAPIITSDQRLIKAPTLPVRTIHL